MNDLAGILAIIGTLFVPVTMVVLIVWFKSSERRKRDRFQAEIVMKAIENGQPVPADLFAAPRAPKKRRSPLYPGLICIGAGVGLALFGGVVGPTLRFVEAWSLGVIPFMIGVAYVILYLVERKQGAGEKTR